MRNKAEKKRVGIIVCGLNGVGKSTLGRALAERLQFHFIDNEDLFFPKSDPNYLYSSPRTHEEAKLLLLDEIKAHESFVFAAVKGDFGEWLYPYFSYAVLIEAPREIRIERVKNRSYQKFGERMRHGGDLYETEERFFDLVKSRPEGIVEEWLKQIRCPVLRVDGTNAVADNVDYIIGQIQKSPVCPAE